MEDLLKSLIGPGAGPKDLNSLQVSVRAIIVFAATIWIVRVGEKRFLAQRTAYDAVLAFILASMLSRAINGSAAFVATICGGFVLVLLHRALAFLARRFHSISSLVKGTSDLVIENGEIKQDAQARNDYSEGDLMEDLRREGVAGAKEVKLAYIERNGETSVIKRID